MNNYYQEPYAQIIQGDCREVLVELPAESVQMVCTSPPYWGKRKYEGEQDLIWDDWEGAYGYEPTPEMYVEHTIEILRAIRRVLRRDGIVFWNIGDTYFGSGGGEHDYREDKHLQQDIYDWEKPQSIGKHSILKSKDICLIPFRVAIAAQEDGWWVRSVVIWNKTNPKPESVEDRPTTSHDYILMLTKSDEYYWDREAVREPLQYDEPRTERIVYSGKSEATSTFLPPSRAGRNIRSVWTFPTQSFSGAHFAIFPDDLPELCIKAATPEVGCCGICGAPWERVVDAQSVATRDIKKGDYKTLDPERHIRLSRTIGWQPICNCNADKVPSLVLDPFAGTGTTGKVAKTLGRRSILIDTSERYCGMAKRRIEKVALPMIIPVEEYYPEAPDWF